MALGDIAFGEDAPSEITRLNGNFAGRDIKTFLNTRVFRLEVESTGSGAWRFAWANRQRMRTIKKLKLIDVIDTVTDRLVISSGGSRREVNVAHQSIALFSARGGLFDTHNPDVVESIVQEYLTNALPGKFDDEIGFRVFCSAADFLKQEEICIVLGRSVFLPKRGEEPIGFIRFHPDPESYPSRYGSVPSFRASARENSVEAPNSVHRESPSRLQGESRCRAVPAPALSP